MFKRTKGMIGNTLDLIKGIGFGIDLFFKIIYIGYLILAIFFNIGMLWAKIVILSFSVIYFVIHLTYHKRWLTYEQKENKKKVDFLYKCSKRIIDLAVLVISIIQLILYPSKYDLMNILLTIVMLFGFSLNLTFDILTGIFTTKIEMLVVAVELDVYDMNIVQRPINFVRDKLGLVVYKKHYDEKIIEKINRISDEQELIRKQGKIFKKKEKEIQKTKFKKECVDRHQQVMYQKTKQALVVAEDGYEITYEQARGELEKNYDYAKKVLKSKTLTTDLLIRLEKKLKTIPIFGNDLSYFVVFGQLLKAYIKKEYTMIPIGSIVSITSALIYFVSPVDLISDVIPVIGHFDDAAIATICYNLVKSDLDEFIEWRDICQQ